MGTKKKQKRRHFTPEYKADVVRLVQTGEKTAGQVARDLELTETSVRARVCQAEIDQCKGASGAFTVVARQLNERPLKTLGFRTPAGTRAAVLR